MRPYPVLAAAVLAVTACAVVLDPHGMLSPGDLSEGHRGLEGDCFSCHAPFRGPDARCRDCHTLTDFHASLIEPDCASCHTDHRGRAGATVRAFDHALLRTELQERCADCHDRPHDDFHESIESGCARCHEAGTWKSSFDHAPLFRFDRDHPPRCATCHAASLQSYDCYGCHEHEPAEIEGEHREEGILDVARCADCHRSADDEGRRRRRRR